jgi:hypothetical protein
MSNYDNYPEEVQDNSLWIQGQKLNDSLKGFPSKYEFVYYDIDPASSLLKTNVTKCFAASQIDDEHISYAPSLNMKEFGNGDLHTAESCRLNASLLKSYYLWDEFKSPQSNYFNMASLSNQSKREQGLHFKIYQGYFGDNDWGSNDAGADIRFPTLPLYPGIKNTGVTNDLTNLTTGLTDIKGGAPVICAENNCGNGVQPQSSVREYYTVDWYGFFKPPVDGIYNFDVGGDDATYLWLGDYAAEGQSKIANAMVKVPNLHGVQNNNAYTNNTQFLLHKGAAITSLNSNTYYPIRIRFGQNWGGHNVNFTVTDPNKKQFHGNKNGAIIFYTAEKESYTPGALTSRDVYYAIQENTPKDTKKGLFKCYITDNTDINIFQQYTNPNASPVAVKVLWSAIYNPYTPFKAISAKLTDDGTDFSLYNDNGSKINLYHGTPVDFIQIGDDGEIYAGPPGSANKITNIGDTTSVANSIWQNMFYKQDATNIGYGNKIKKGASLSRSSGDYIRFSSNGKYAVMMDAGNNFVVLGNEVGCDSVNNVTSDGTIFTKNSPVSSYQVYTAVGDMKYNKIFVKDKDNVDSNGNKVEKMYNLLPTETKMGTTYSQYPGYEPSLLQNANATNDSPAACQQKCNGDDNCKYYYTYTDSANKNYCLLSTNDAKSTDQQSLENSIEIDNFSTQNNSYISFSVGQDLLFKNNPRPSSPFTLEAWIYPKTFEGTSGTLSTTGNLPYNPTNGTFHIPSFIGDMNTQDWMNWWSFGPNVNGNLSFYFWNNHWNGFTGNAPISLNKWNHIALTTDGKSKFTLYVNGQVDKTMNYNDLNMNNGANVLSMNHMVIGRYSNQNNYGASVGPFSFNGYFSNLRITNRELTSFTVNPNRSLTQDADTEILIKVVNNTPVDVTNHHSLQLSNINTVPDQPFFKITTDGYTDLPNSFKPLQSKNLGSSTLYIRDYKNDDTKYGGASNAHLIDLLPSYKTADVTNVQNSIIQPLGSDNTGAIENALKGIDVQFGNQRCLWEGTCENFTSTIEPLTVNGGPMPGSYSDINALQMNHISSDFTGPIQDRESNVRYALHLANDELPIFNDRLDDVSYNYGIIKTNYANTKKLRDIMNNDVSTYDFSGNYLQRKPSILDAVVEDSSNMVYYQHSSYILGTMTVAAMLIVTILLMKD